MRSRLACSLVVRAFGRLLSLARLLGLRAFCPRASWALVWLASCLRRKSLRPLASNKLASLLPLVAPRAFARFLCLGSLLARLLRASCSRLCSLKIKTKIKTLVLQNQRRRSKTSNYSKQFSKQFTRLGRGAPSWAPSSFLPSSSSCGNKRFLRFCFLDDA